MELDEKNIEIFKKDVQKFAIIDKQIKEAKEMMKPLQDRIKILQGEKKELEQEICSTMEINNLQEADLPNNTGTIEYICKNTAVPITQKTIKDKMISFFENGPGSESIFNSKNNKDKGLILHNYIYAKENRDFIKKEQLKSKKN